VFTIALHAYYFFSGPAPIFSWSFPLTETLFSSLFGNYYTRIIIAIVLIALQAIIVNDIVIRHKLSRALSTIPGAMYVILSVIILEPVGFHPVLLANLFCILSLASLFNIYKKHLPIATIFNSGFLMMVAALIYPPYIIYTIVLIIGLMSLRSLELRELLQLITGLLTPLYLLVVYMNMSGAADQVLLHFSGSLTLPWQDMAGVSDTPEGLFTLGKIGLLIIIILASIAFHNSVKKKKKFDAIKKIELAYWMIFVSIFGAFLSREFSSTFFMIVTTPLAIVSGLIMESKENSVLKEFIFLVLIACFFGLLFKGGFIAS